MAVTFQNESTRRGGALYVDFPENILIMPELNGRIENTDVTDLAADIEKNGQNTPVVIRKNDAGVPVLVCGHRRWRAVKLINDRNPEHKIQLVCNYFTLTEMEAFALAIGENRFRKDVTPMDDCHNIALMQKRFKSTVEDIAQIYFPEAKTPEAKSEAVRWVNNRLALQELAPEAAQAVRDDRLKITAAVELSKLSKDQQRAVVAKSTSTVAGKSRIKVSDVKASKPAPRPVKAKGPDPDDVPFDSPAAPAPKSGPMAVPALPSNPILATAEVMARALDAWLLDATDKAEKALIAAHKSYRALVPFARAEGKAA